MGTKSRTAVLGLGNILRRDDGYGPAVTHYLNLRYRFEPEIEIVEVGAPGLDLAPFVNGVDHLLLVDTANLEGKHGEVRILSREDVMSAAEKHAPMVSGHQSDIYAAVWKADYSDEGPKKLCMVAAIPKDLDEGPGLSSTLIEAIPEGIETSLKVLKEWGISYEQIRTDVVEPWWFSQPVQA